jgi:hypothetical protein
VRGEKGGGRGEEWEVRGAKGEWSEGERGEGRGEFVAVREGMRG